jgi:glycosyltransferase involved in cell wall biosynthesis
MRFSLVLATVGRVTEVERFMAALAAQACPDLDLIVVDQNEDDRLEPVLAPYHQSLAIKRLRSPRGLSRARNVGIKFATGDVIAFPDDDCWYPSGLLSRVESLLEGHPDWDGVTGRSEDGQGSASAGRFDPKSGAVDLVNVWGRGISYTIFLRRRVVERVGEFDETLGVGAGTPYGSGEETDYLIRAVRAGFTLQYSPTLVVYHPDPTQGYDARVLRRGRSYGQGMGRVLAKHSYPLWFRARCVFRPLAGTVLSLTTLRFGKAAYHWQVCVGRLVGLRARADGTPPAARGPS